MCSTVTRRRAQARLSATIRRGAGLPAWLAAGRGPEAAGVGVAEADGGAVAERAHPQRQAIAQPRGAQHGAVGGGAAHARGSVHDRAGRLVDRHLDLERVLLFLAAVIVIRHLAVVVTLHALLKGINDYDQLRRRSQQCVQAAAALAAGVGHPHGVTPARFQQRQDTTNRATHGRIADPKEIGQHFVDRIEAQPNDGEEDLIAGVELEVGTSTDGTLPRRPVVAGLLRSMETRQHIGDEGIKLGEVQASHRLEHSRKPLQPLIPQDHLHASSKEVGSHIDASILDLFLITNVN